MPMLSNVAGSTINDGEGESAVTEKERIRIRLLKEVQDVLEAEAAWEGKKLGTLVNEIVRNELEKAKAAGVENCFVEGSRAYESRGGELNVFPGDLYLLPDPDRVKFLLPTRNPESNDAGRQVTVYLLPSEKELLDKLVRIQNVRGTMEDGKVISYRYLLNSLFLNSYVLDELDI